MELNQVISYELLEEWNKEQNKLKEKLILEDVEEWQFSVSKVKNEDKKIRYVAGVDISYIKDRNDLACAGIIILDLLNDLKIIYEDISFVNITQPYIPGYLAFREASFFISKLEKLRIEVPEIYPQCIFVDGNGILHSKRFGLACHLGVMVDTPTIGVAKNLFHVDGIEKNEKLKLDIEQNLVKKGDSLDLICNNGDILGICYRTHTKTPIFISIGHKISINTSKILVDLVSKKYRIPEPIRIADLRTREYIRMYYNKY